MDFATKAVATSGSLVFTQGDSAHGMGVEENKKRGTKTVYVIDHVKPLCALVQTEEGRRINSSPKPGRLAGTLSSP